MPVDLGSLVRPERTAVVLQECQEGVIGKESLLPELAKVAQEELVPNVAALARAARAVGIRVIHCLAVPREDKFGGHRNAPLFMATRRAGSRIHAGSPGACAVEGIDVAPEDVVLTRMQGLTPFRYSELDPILRNEGIGTIVACGVSLNVAVTALTFEAVTAGYQVVIPRDAVAGVPRAYGEAVLDNTLRVVATLTTTAELIALWQ
ncbi:MAG: cysteine hydrolase [Deltaproteobacteria bacterium]|nr:cysteine hydrolase [Deltaproteobacteria bacterium]